jgi:predicted ABC-type sugar transport system permease subunit
LFPSTSKSVWMAIFRTALLGPIGMLYSTVTGALVMSVVSAVVLIFAGSRWMWISWAACIVWAALAARD